MYPMSPALRHLVLGSLPVSQGVVESNHGDAGRFLSQCFQVAGGRGIITSRCGEIHVAEGGTISFSRDAFQLAQFPRFPIY
jgi:hypothetical protein